MSQDSSRKKKRYWLLPSQQISCCPPHWGQIFPMQSAHSHAWLLLQQEAFPPETPSAAHQEISLHQFSRCSLMPSSWHLKPTITLGYKPMSGSEPTLVTKILCSLDVVIIHWIPSGSRNMPKKVQVWGRYRESAFSPSHPILHTDSHSWYHVLTLFFPPSTPYQTPNNSFLCSSSLPWCSEHLWSPKLHMSKF
jgi:hypothetical protein